MTTAPANGEIDLPAPEWTVDELAAETGVTVRNIRYYVTMGLLPAPTRRGRMAYFSGAHRARISLIQTMQDQGLSLAAIEQHLARLSKDAPTSEIEMRRALFSAWAPLPAPPLTQQELERRAGRTLSIRDLAVLERLGMIRPTTDGIEVEPTFDVGVALLDLDIPLDSIEAANDAVRQHMTDLVQELRQILRTKVLAPLRDHQAELDPAEFARSMMQLQRLTLDSIVGHYQVAAIGLLDVPAPLPPEERS